MAIYRCAQCDEFVDNDYHPCEEPPLSSAPGDVWCPACVEDFNDEYDVWNSTLDEEDWYAICSNETPVS